MTIDPNRREQRELLIARRNALRDDLRRAQSAQLVAHLRATLEGRFGPLNWLNVGAYLPLGSEPDITELFASLGTVSLPQVVSKDAPLRFLTYRPGMALHTEAFGVRVPVEQNLASPSILLVPCVGFYPRPDGCVDRLGYGGGFYDRTLAAGAFLTLGVAFSVSAMKTFASAVHDCPLDGLVTEDGPIGSIGRGG